MGDFNALPAKSSHFSDSRREAGQRMISSGNAEAPDFCGKVYCRLARMKRDDSRLAQRRGEHVRYRNRPCRINHHIIDDNLLGKTEWQMLLPRQPQVAPRRQIRRHWLQSALADPCHGKARRARGLGRGLAYCMNRQVRELRQLRPAQPKGIGAARQQRGVGLPVWGLAVWGLPVWRIPFGRRHGEQRRGVNLQA